MQNVQMGDTQYPIAESAIIIVLFLSLSFNVFLFKRGNGSYSIKYELMAKGEVFRKHILLTYVIEGLYKFFFVLPFLLLAAVSILTAIRDTTSLAPILINGLIIILILYPTKTEHYYFKLFAMWLLVMGSQLSTFFLYEGKGDQAYLILSAIFYTANVFFYFLAFVAIEQDYYEISEAIAVHNRKYRQDGTEIKGWIQQAYIPKIFDGGLYGRFRKSGNPNTIFAVLYFLSLLFLVCYALLVYFILGSNLGFVGLVSSFVYDIFVYILNALDGKVRSLTSTFVVLVAGRFLSFVFGLENWLLGYCVLYFGVSIFMGYIIIEKRFPLKHKSKKKQSNTYENAFRTPQFALLALTVEIIVMILVQAYAITASDPTVTYNNITIPVWQWGILAVLASWVVNIYLASVRVMLRHRNKIFTLTEYYFGIESITEYHIYLFTSYLLLIALGVYAMVYLGEKLVLVSCLFLPLMYECLAAMGTAWSTNQYMVLADIDEYNKIAEKKYEVRMKKQAMLEKSKQDKEKEKKMHMLMDRNSTKMIASMSKIPSVLNKPDEIRMGVETDNQVSGNQLMSRFHENSQKVLDQPQEQDTQKPFRLRNWRDESENVKLNQLWGCLTKHDKKIIVSALVFILLSIGYCLTSMLWCLNKFAISVLVCVISYLTLVPYYKFYRTKEQIIVSEIVGNWIGFALGIIYWSVFNQQIVGPIAFSACHIVLCVYLFLACCKTEVRKQVITNLPIQIVMNLAFIQIIITLHTNHLAAVIFAICFFITAVLLAGLLLKVIKGSIPKLVYAIAGLLIGATVIVLAVVGFAYDFLSSFAIFTIVMVMVYLAVFVTCIVFYVLSLRKSEDNPNIYSAYGEPNFRFNSAKEQLVNNEIHLILFSVSMVVVVIYSVVVAVFFQEKQWAVFGLSFFWLLQFFIAFNTAMSCYKFIGHFRKKDYITEQIVMASFERTKQFMRQYGDEDDEENSEKYFKLYHEMKEKAEKSDDPEDWKLVVTYYNLYAKNVREEERFIFFWLGLIMFNLVAKRKSVIETNLAEWKEIQDQLEACGISIDLLNLNLKPKQKYEKIMTQLENLSPIDFILYERILEEHRAEVKRTNQLNEKKHEQQKIELQKRQKQLFDTMSRDAEKNPNEQIGNFQKMVKNLKKVLFIDKDFPTSEESLGLLSGKVKKWKRPDTNQELSKGGFSAADVKQGQIGDCYLISSFGVLGDKRIKQVFGYDENGVERWSNTKGAYMVRFFKFAKEKFVIIDDLIPANDEGEWVFAKSEDSNQFWPCILEKAYAKMYGGYHKIIQGKCHQVMAEFTGGFPFEILLQQYKLNPNGLWTRIISSTKNGYLLAAGSPPAPMGDRESSKRGIVKGHAYSILDAKQVDEYKLIKLKNPHGSSGIEWNGDFCDNSDLMTKRMMGILGHERSDDGIFWMKIEDFIYEFRSLYICAVFDDRWKKLQQYKGQWTKSNSFGTPNNIGCEKNPHVGITITKKCTLFISLTQESVTSLKGKNFIYIKAVKNQGKRITPEDLVPEKAIGKPKRPSDLVTVSIELQLEASSYPYTFSIILCCAKAGETGTFSVEAFCDDKQATLIKNEDFDKKN